MDYSKRFTGLRHGPFSVGKAPEPTPTPAPPPPPSAARKGGEGNELLVLMLLFLLFRNTGDEEFLILVAVLWGQWFS